MTNKNNIKQAGRKPGRKPSVKKIETDIESVAVEKGQVESIIEEDLTNELNEKEVQNAKETWKKRAEDKEAHFQSKTLDETPVIPPYEATLTEEESKAIDERVLIENEESKKAPVRELKEAPIKIDDEKEKEAEKEEDDLVKTFSDFTEDKEQKPKRRMTYEEMFGERGYLY